MRSKPAAGLWCGLGVFVWGLGLTLLLAGRTPRARTAPQVHGLRDQSHEQREVARDPAGRVARSVHDSLQVRTHRCRNSQSRNAAGVPSASHACVAAAGLDAKDLLSTLV